MKTIVIKINSTKPQLSKIKKAADVLRNGGLVAFPTETVYGLGANLLDRKAVRKLYEIKKRPRNKPLTIHVAGIEAVEAMVGRMPEKAKILAEEFWPGPLTLILKDDNGKKTGFRIPDNKAALLLLKAAGVPVVAPSANLSGCLPPADAKEAFDNFNGNIEMVLDGGRARIGVASTVVEAGSRGYKILREGAISRARIQEVLSKSLGGAR
ncbi:MAG: L-threonylcarbamoyladenylate synthase [Candidatus Omnitrophota bacterium]